MTTRCGTVPVYIMAPGERIPVQIDWHDWLIRQREPGVSVALDAVIRPPRNLATGFQYRCSVAGVTSCLPFFRLRWPHSVGLTVIDGSVTWEAEPIDEESLRTTITAEAWNATDGMTLSAQSAADSIYYTQAEGGSGGQEFMITHAADFANGEKRAQSVQINVES